MFRIATILISLAMLGACATTSFSSYKDPAFTDATFQSLAVFADSGDLEWRQDLETIMHDRIVATTGARAMRMVDIVPPTRDLDTSEMFQVLRAAGADAVLVVAFIDSGVTQTVSGNQYGVYTIESPWAQADVAVYEVETGTKVLTGTAKTEGDTGADWRTVRRSAGDKIIEDLVVKGLLPPPDE